MTLPTCKLEAIIELQLEEDHLDAAAVLKHVMTHPDFEEEFTSAMHAIVARLLPHGMTVADVFSVGTTVKIVR